MQYSVPSALKRWYNNIALVLLQFHLLSVTIFSADGHKGICRGASVALVAGEYRYEVNMV